MRFRLFLLLWLVASNSAFAELVIGKPAWGFNGTAVQDCFNILTVEVRNTGGQAYEGALTLDDGARFGSRDSAPYVQNVFIAPGTTRTVQFYPYVVGSFEFRLTWGARGGGNVDVVAPDAGPPAVVLLADLDAPSLRSLAMPAFNEAYFPPTASATDGLHSVVLDHQPRWDPARREAFLEWLKRGGLVHVINGPDGSLPQFTGELGVLNDPAQRFSVGAGLVVKHTATRTEVTPEFLASAGFPAPEFRKDRSVGYDDGDRGIFRQLSTITKPNISWGLIYLLTFLYVGIVGPLFYFLRKRDHRLLLGGFIATVGLFAWIFTVVGRRGYGEKQVYHSVAVARSIEGAKWDVRHWVHAFATNGGMYRFAMPGVSQLYASGGDGEAVRGEVIEGREASFSADIPLFSSRPFLHQGVMNGPDLVWEVSEFEAGSGKSEIRKLKLKQKGAFAGQWLSMAVQYGNKFYMVRSRNDQWALANSGGNLANAFETGDSGQTHYYSHYGETPAMSLERLRKRPLHLAQRIAGEGDSRHVPLARPPETGRIRLFAYADAPKTFALENSDFQAGHNFVLFVQDIALPANSNP